MAHPLDLDVLWGAPDIGGDGVHEELMSAVTDVVEQRRSPFNNLMSFSRQLKRSGICISGPSDLEIMNDKVPIGTGATLATFKAALRPSGQVVAVKRLKIESATGATAQELQQREFRDALASLILELRVMMHPWFLTHRNIIDLIAVAWETDATDNDDLLSNVRPMLIVELANEAHPTLFSAVSDDALWLSETQRFQLLEDLAEAMMVIHSAKMVHGDLKPENVLLFWQANRFIAKVSDFGFSGPYLKNDQDIYGTRYWNAPECLPNAPESIAPFRTTITRDIFSYGLIMWFVLFDELPFGPYNVANVQEIDQQKLHEDTESLIWRMGHKFSSKIIEPESDRKEDEKLDENTQTGIMWWQIFVAMREMFQVHPKSRDIALGEVHRIFDRPESARRTWRPSRVKRRQETYIRRTDAQGQDDRPRPHAIAAIAKDEQTSAYASSSAFHLTSLQPALQEKIFREMLAKLDSMSSTDPEYADYHCVVASYYRIGVGVEKSTPIADEYDFKAARLGSQAGQYATLVTHFSRKTELDIDDNTKVDWLLHALTLDPFHSRYERQRNIATDVQRRLQEVPKDLLLPCLKFAFEEMHTTELRIYHGWYGDPSENEPLNLTTTGNVEALCELLTATPSLKDEDYGGTHLIHIAADYGHERILKLMIQEYEVSVDQKDVQGNTVLESAVCTGNLECSLLLLGLGASPYPLLNQDTFTSVATVGCRRAGDSLECGGPGRIRELLRVIMEGAKLALETHSTRESLITESTVDTVSQHLLDGQFRCQRRKEVTETSDSSEWQADENPHFTPLQYAVSTAHYDSVFALCTLGAQVNTFNNQHPPLHLAVMLKDPLLVAYLLANGADPNLRDAEDEDFLTPLHYANSFSTFISYEVPQVERLRMQDIIDEETAALGEGQSPKSDPMQEAGTKDQFVLAIIHLLVQAGADVDLKDGKERTPLKLAKDHGDEKTVECLASLRSQAES